ncbi:MAG TPA: methylenetetrahydrofolate reductase C-terminal domain-containing protein [Tepidisphaeraceae bacterium]|jgi:methylenetetrahydrofolate reductase (NADPH)|nr:methylenetetrahydrofolate reductase C-terminal domain-containing protein [Tepidisphaeraceae bacterium]
MYSLAEKLATPDAFLLGVELVSTRGTMVDQQAVQARAFASQLVSLDKIDWVSITDNAGGNPQLSPMALGKPILYAGKEVLIHLSCKDFNRNGLESAAWELASEGFRNILALSGDYPAAGYHGRGKPVFDIDSVGLLTMLDEMNRGLSRPKVRATGQSQTLAATNFFAGAVATNFKKYENEVVPQLLKLEKKVQCGAKFIIAQIGYDSRKSHEMRCYMQQRGMGHIPLIGNVFLLTAAAARFFRTKTIPGVVISDSLFAECEKRANGFDKGKRWFLELAARQLAIFRGLKFAGGYLGGVHRMEDVQAILEIESTFSPDDWKEFARAIVYPQSDEFYYYAKDDSTGLADSSRLEPGYEASLKVRKSTHNVTLGYRFSKWAHDAVFTPGTALFRLGRKIYSSSKDPMQGPRSLRVLEHVSKAAMFHCKDCGDCSLPDIGFLCPESQCAKNQRNGPCGGTRDGKCEVHDFECIWARAYDRLKYEGREQDLLVHSPVIQDETLRGTSSWGNAFLGRDHTAKKPDAFEVKAAPPPLEGEAPAEPHRSTTADAARQEPRPPITQTGNPHDASKSNSDKTDVAKSAAV